jgi:hypothetical protein
MSLEHVLTSAREEDSQLYLAKHPGILLATLGRAVYSNCLIPKFRFGNEHVSDFVFIERGSITVGSPWIFIYLVELEPPTSRPFTRAGSYAERLNMAIGQVTDWMSWIRSNDAYFRASLSKAVRSDTAFHAPGFDLNEMINYLSEPHTSKNTSSVLRRWGGNDQSTAFQTSTLLINAKIIIGRRSMFSSDDNRRRASLFYESQQKIEIIPYDRLVDAERFLATATSSRAWFEPQNDGLIHPGDDSDNK